MESSSVYMCFPCYQEFPTLEEVLAHQLTCSVESPNVSSAEPQHISQPEEQQVQHQLIQDVVPQEDFAHPPDPPIDTGGLDLHVGAGDTPRILYQCGDCEVLFDSLTLWQHHRKLGECQQGAVETASDSASAATAQEEQVEVNEKHPPTDTTAAAPEEPSASEAADTTSAAPPVDVDAVPAPIPPADPPIRRRGVKKAKPPSSLLCIECGTAFSAIAELVSHRRTQHDLREALHRCQVCGEGFLNTTLFLYHRKQHPQPHPSHGSLPTTPPKAPAAAQHSQLVLTPSGQAAKLLAVQQEVQVEVLEEISQGQGLLLLAAAGEEQSLGLNPVSTTTGLDVSTAISELSNQDVHTESQGTPTDDQTIHANAQTTDTDTKANEPCVEVLHCETETNQPEEGGPKRKEREIAEEKEEDLMEVESPGTFLCRSCGASFCSQEELQSHRLKRHGQSGALHTCEVCGQEFMNTTLFLYHRKEHRTTTLTHSLHETLIDIQQSVEDPGSAICSDTVEFPEISAGAPAMVTCAVLAPGSSSEVALSSDPIPPPPAQLSRDWSRAALPHRCPHCGRSFTRRSLLRAHVSSHTGQKLFRCAVCTKAFSSPANLLRHSQTHAPTHSLDRPHRCHICGKHFSQQTTLKRHLLTHSSGAYARRAVRFGKAGLRAEDEGPFLHSCPECSASFKTFSQLQKHRLLHTSHPFPCEVCGEAFKRRKDLNLHSLTHQEPKTCPSCGGQFLNQMVLQVHLQRCLSNQVEVGTEGVESATSRRGRGRGQGRGRAGGQLECEMCGHLCVTQEGLELHRLSHTGQTPLRCPLAPCRRRFASGAALGEHVLAHCQGLQGKQRAPSRYRCQHCGKEFAYASTFAVHMRIHTDERPFECTHCGKRFRQLPHLQDHERIHSGLRPFACWVCGKSFSVAARLTEHARVHSGEKPYVCRRCPAAFRSRANLDKHMHVHGEELGDDAEAGLGGEGKAAVQTILLVHQAASPPHPHAMALGAVEEAQIEVQDGGSTILLPAEQAAGAGLIAVPGSPSSSVVILHPTITVPSTAGVPNISLVEGQDVPHTIEFIIEETV